VALLNEYRMALGVWSETRALYSSENSEVAEAESYLEDLEGGIMWLYGNSTIPITQSLGVAVDARVDGFEVASSKVEYQDVMFAT